MNPSNWQHMWAVFDAALDQSDADAQRRLVHEACTGDTALESEVLTLLAAHRADSPLDTAPPLPAPLAPPSGRIGPYEIIEEIGRGGMGVVFKARDERLSRPVALKMLPHHLCGDEAAKARFIAEARAAAALEHPNIATIYDIGEAPNRQLYIAMAFYEGETLFDRLRRGPLDVDDALDVALHVSAGLSRAHERQIVHRDIKPANILLASDGGVKILDFGIAKMASLEYTTAGVPVGTVSYMSPEQARGNDVDHRSDVWSLGVVLYEMIVGRRPFDGAHRDEVIDAILHESPASLHSHRTDMPIGLANIVARALRKDPQDRYASAEAFAAALSTLPGRTNPSRTAGLPAAVPERLRATVIVSQLHGYVQLMECLVPDELRAVNERIRRDLEALLHNWDGLLHECSGDTIVALFGVPEAQEDAYVRAVRAARRMHAYVRTVSDELEKRAGCRLAAATGIDTGLLVVQTQDDDLSVTGTALHIATQLSLHAEADEILISPDCERLVRPFFETRPGHATRIKGSSATIVPYRITGETGLQTRLEAAEKSGMTPYSGRSAEMHELEQAYSRAMAGSGQFVTVVGEAGLGKSRLLYEFVRRIEHDGTVLKGRCQAYGEKVAYLPFIDLLRQSFGLTKDMTSEEMEATIVERIADLDESLDIFVPLYLHVLSIDAKDRPLPDHLQGEDLRMASVEAISGVVTLSARRRPTILLLEDWHWADAASRDVLTQVADVAASYPLLVIVTYRPEQQSSWSYAGHHTRIYLKPLDASSSRAVIGAVFGAREISDDLARRLHHRTGGNPFFLEEVSRTLLEENLVAVDDGTATPTRPLEAIDLPDSVQAVIRSRLHRLDHQSRKALRVAAVIGREFSREVLADVLPQDTDLPAALTQLRDAGLIQQVHVLPEAVFRFKHVLTQDVAYDSLLQHQRKALHQQVGETIERRSAGRLDEHLDLLVHHFATAEDYRRAATYGKNAARRSIRMSRFTDADTLLTDVRAWLQNLTDEPWRRELLIEVLLEHERVCETLGDRTEQQRIIDDLIELIPEGGDRSTLAEVHRRQGDLFILRRRLEEAEDALADALACAEASNDDDVERRILRSIGFLRWHQGRSDEAVALNEKLLALHRESGDDRAVVGDLVNLCIIMRDNRKYDEALAYLMQTEDVVHRIENPSLEAYVYHSLATIHQLTGDDEEALAHFERSRAIAEAQRLPLQLSFDLMSIAHIALKLGEIDRSIETYKEAIELSRRSRYADGLAKSLLVFGDILLSLQRYDDALEYLTEAADWFLQLEDAASEADALAKIATIHERERRLDEAEAAWRRIAERLEILGVAIEIDTYEAFARLARSRGDEAEALAHYLDAVDLCARAGDAAREARLRNSAGILEWQRSRFEEALAHFTRAHELFREIEDYDGIGLMLNSIAISLFRLNRYQEADARLRNAIESHRAENRPQLEAHALAVLGDICADDDRLDEAAEAYAESLHLRWDLNDRLGEGWMLHHLADLHARAGRHGRAREYLEQAWSIASEEKDERLTAACSDLEEVSATAPQ